MNAARSQFDQEHSEFQETWLSAYLDDELSDEQRDIVEQRLADDPITRQTLADLERVRDLVTKLPGWNGEPITLDVSALSADDAENDSLTQPRPLEVEPVEQSAHPNTEVLKANLSGLPDHGSVQSRSTLWPWLKPLAVAASLLAMVGIAYGLWRTTSTTRLANATPTSARSEEQADATPPAESMAARGDTSQTRPESSSSNYGVSDFSYRSVQDEPPSEAEQPLSAQSRSRNFGAPLPQSQGMEGTEPSAASALSLSLSEAEDTLPSATDGEGEELAALPPTQRLLSEEWALREQVAEPAAAGGFGGGLSADTSPPGMTLSAGETAQPALKTLVNEFTIHNAPQWSEEEVALALVELAPLLTPVERFAAQTSPAPSGGRQGTTALANQYPLYFARVESSERISELGKAFGIETDLSSSRDAAATYFNFQQAPQLGLGAAKEPQKLNSPASDSPPSESLEKGQLADNAAAASPAQDQSEFDNATPKSQPPYGKQTESQVSPRRTVFLLTRRQAEQMLSELSTQSPASSQWFAISSTEQSRRPSPEDKVIVILSPQGTE